MVPGRPGRRGGHGGLWGLLVVLAARLPPGLLRDLAGLWVLSPIDLLPEFLPVIGPLDDVVVVALALRYAATSCWPRPTLPRSSC